ncbi:MAG: GtrA family protein [Candidatus Dojkabacteria bacterium]
MKSKITNLIHKLLALKFMRFLISGIFAFSIDTGILIFVKIVLFNGTDYKLFQVLSIAKLISASVGMITMFMLNRAWVFVESKNGNVKKQGAKYILINLVTLVIASILYSFYYSVITTFLSGTTINTTILISLANFLTEGTKMVISFFAYKYLVFR